MYEYLETITEMLMCNQTSRFPWYNFIENIKENKKQLIKC